MTQGGQNVRATRFATALKLGATLLASATWGAAHAQTAPNQTPPGATAEEPSPPSRFSFPPAQGLSAPAGAEAARFTLTDIVVDGEFAELEAQSDALEGQLRGREISVSDVYGFAASLQQAYFDAGFPLSRVVVPPQELGADGRVRVVVVDGFVSAIDTTQLHPNVRARVARVLSSLVGVRKPTSAAIERRLLLAGDTAGLSLTSTLAPGSDVGATVLVLSGAYDGANGVVAFDNRVSDQLGDYQGTVSASLNSPFGWGERFVATLAGLPESDVFSEDAVRRYVAFGFDLPLGDNGLSLNIDADYSSTRPEGSVAAQKLHSEYARVGAGLSYPFIRTRSGNLSGALQFDAISDIQRTEIGGPSITLAADRLRVLRLTLNGDVALPDRARLALNAGVSHGIDGLGARARSDASVVKPLTRGGADAEFTAFDAGVRFAASAPLGALFSLSARGRHSFGDPLLRAEQFSPSGWDALSGPPSGQMIGDSGFVARAELARPFGEANAQFSPYVFATAAQAHLEQPSALERSNTEADSFGAGIRIGLGERPLGGNAVSFVLEWSRTSSDDRDLDDDWTSAAVAFRF